MDHHLPVAGEVFSLSGNHAQLHFTCDSFTHLTQVTEAAYFLLPLLISVEFADPVYIEAVEAHIEDQHFRWELAGWMAPFEATSQQCQQERVERALRRYSLVAAPAQRRLLGALHYFHIACRLLGQGSYPGEFLAESLLNFDRCLVVLYGPKRDSVRSALRNLGFSEAEIEGQFIPIMLLRNSIDVGHPSLATLSRDQLEVLQRFADNAEGSFRFLLSSLLRALESGSDVIPSYEDDGPDPALVRTIEILRKHLDAS